jgi:hypothetical protein
VSKKRPGATGALFVLATTFSPIFPNLIITTYYLLLLWLPLRASASAAAARLRHRLLARKIRGVVSWDGYVRASRSQRSSFPWPLFLAAAADLPQPSSLGEFCFRRSGRHQLQRESHRELFERFRGFRSDIAELAQIPGRTFVPGLTLHPSGALIYQPFLTGRRFRVRRHHADHPGQWFSIRHCRFVQRKNRRHNL